MNKELLVDNLLLQLTYFLPLRWNSKGFSLKRWDDLLEKNSFLANILSSTVRSMEYLYHLPTQKTENRKPLTSKDVLSGVVAVSSQLAVKPNGVT